MNIISETKTKNCWTKTTDTFREKTIFSFFFISVSGSLIISTKRFLGPIKVRQQLTITRYAEFDSGWTYSHYWGKESETWEHVSIIHTHTNK